MPIDKLHQATETIKITIKDIRNEDYDADEILRKRITIPDPTKINRTIREIRT